MKFIAFAIMLLCISTFCTAQRNGKIISENSAPKAGEENFYQYQPPIGLAVPDKIMVGLVYNYYGIGYHYKTIPLVKSGDHYRFSIKLPDSVTACIMVIVDDKEAIFDNNFAAGYTFYMCDKTGKRFEASGINLAQLLSGYAPHKLKLSIQAGDIVKIYNEEYKIYPALKKDSYAGYLKVLYSAKGDTVKPQLLAYAKKELAEKNGENEWSNALMIYEILKMDSAAKLTSQKILSTYPKGALAQNNFWIKIYQDKSPTVEKWLNYMHEYFKKFTDSSALIRDRFYQKIMSIYAEKKDWDNLEKYSSLVTNKAFTAGIYNNLAWGMSGQELNNEGHDLALASYFSAKALKAVKEKVDDPNIMEDDKAAWRDNYYNDAGTYALILYKLKKYDSAFFYEAMILTEGSFDVGDVERYAAYAEKAKGAVFVRPYIEQQLLSGINSIILQNQLQSIYKELNLPDDTYNTVKNKAVAIAKQKTVESIKAILGSTEGKDFSLKDLDGNTVTLASLKDKVVVLDFWATWCGPCRASFPAMQETVTKYKNDKDVVFLFVDVAEQGDATEIKKNVAKFISDNHYTFTVVLDEKNSVSNDYRVESILEKFVIDKSGNIVMMGNEINDLPAFIEAAK